MGLSATSPALLAPLARAAGSSAPTAGLGRPASQTPGTVDIVTLAGWGPGEGASLLRVRVYNIYIASYIIYEWEVKHFLLWVELVKV